MSSNQHMWPTERVLALLDAVRPTGPGQWMAQCPSHKDRTPSLSIREGDDGRVLIYCFAQCGAYRVLDAIGLDMADLYPERLDSSPQRAQGRRRAAPPISARDALELLEHETLVVEIVAHRIAEGEPLDEHLCTSLERAGSRIGAIRSAWRMSP